MLFSGEEVLIIDEFYTPIILRLQVRLKGVQVLSFAIIRKVAICTEYRQFGKRSIVLES